MLLLLIFMMFFMSTATLTLQFQDSVTPVDTGLDDAHWNPPTWNEFLDARRQLTSGKAPDSSGIYKGKGEFHDLQNWLGVGMLDIFSKLTRRILNKKN